jgi:hypothetical protein
VISRHAAKDALFTADDGTPAAWTYRHIEAKGRIFASLLHGTIDLLRNMSVVKHRGLGLTAIAQFAGAIGSAHRAVFYVRRMHTRRFAVHRRVVSANTAGDVC